MTAKALAMNLPQRNTTDPASGEDLRSKFQRIRQTTLELCSGLAAEDMVVQSMPDASPTKWHLAHTTWFFEQFILSQHSANYQPYDSDWQYLFNSYYHSVGQMFQRQRRGLLSRPTVAEIIAYRNYVDEHMDALLDDASTDADLAFVTELGINHEQQHQELLLTDIKHALAQNPLKPAMTESTLSETVAPGDMNFSDHTGGKIRIGAQQSGFCFDNETPRHSVHLHPFELATRTVRNSEYLEFIRDGGYTKNDLWLSDGWAMVLEQGWQRPIYWSRDHDSEFSLYGEIELNPDRPVSHLSYYEANAFARWADARLPTESEWECVAAHEPVVGNLSGSGDMHPVGNGNIREHSDFFGDVWEWTASSYSGYPGFKPLAGSLGEYNGKFMCSQITLRGGSCVTPADHIRASYRNFFYPDARWQFSGIRLARDL